MLRLREEEIDCIDVVRRNFHKMTFNMHRYINKYESTVYTQWGAKLSQ